MRRAGLLALVVLLAPPLLADTVYKWVDEEGRTHYSQEKPTHKRARPVDVRPNLIPGLSAAERRQAKELDAKNAAAKKAAEAKRATKNKADQQTEPVPPPRRAGDAAATAECGTNPTAGCAMVDMPPGAPVLPADPFEQVGAPAATPAIPALP
jgi:hypothetical protein